ncbi:MAG: sulfatase-like hydrolase/transferase [Synergistaceae bacterium]|nr:sulfatase-like hydrolase/transferase [Synergistaceae bacterium]
MLLTERHGTARNGTSLGLACLEWLEGESSFIFWMVVLNLTVVTFDLTYRTNLRDNIFIRQVIIFTVDVAIILFLAVILDIILYFLFRRLSFLHKFAKIFFLIVNIFMFSIDLFTIYHYQIPLNVAMFDIVMMTNFREGSEFLQMYLTDKNFWLYILFVAALIFIAWKLFALIIRNKALFCVLILVTFCYGGFAAIRDTFFRKTIRNIVNYVGASRLYSILSHSYEGRSAYQKMLKEAPQNPIITRNDSSIPYVVFILGESTNRKHMSIYGYELNTTPNLLKRQNENRLYVFNDVVSAGFNTYTSLQKIFTFYRYGYAKNWFNYMNLLSILNSANYHTVWLSNQENNVNADVISFFPKLCRVNKFTELKDNWDFGTAYDEELLPMLDKELKHLHEKNFYLLHLMGTHGAYKKRYPEDYEKFSAKDETGGFEGINEDQKQVRAEYDNAVLYNDYIINEIVERFEDKNAIVIYISDHGLEIFDTINFSGHTSKIASGCEIPFIIWLSEKFAASYPEIEARIASSVNKPYMTDDMIHTVLDIMQIETPEYDPTKSIINPSFDVTRPRIYSGHLYDKEKGLIAIQ